MSTLIKYDGAIAAFASPLRVHFCPPLRDLGDDDPARRFVYAMAVYANAIAAGELERPYADEAAELYARELLVDEDDFTAAVVAGDSDEQLAARFNVPLEQIAHRRAELAPTRSRA